MKNKGSRYLFYIFSLICFVFLFTNHIEASSLEGEVALGQESSIVVEESASTEESSHIVDETEPTAADVDISKTTPSLATETSDEEASISESASETINTAEEIAETIQYEAVLEEETSAIENDEKILEEPQTIEEIPEATRNEEIEVVSFMVLSEAPTYVIQEKDGNLYIVDSVTAEVRQDNAWVELDGKWYFPNAEGKLYRNRWISFGPSILHYMGDNGAAYTGVRMLGRNLHLFDDENLQSGVIRKDNAWVSYKGEEYFPNAEGNLYHDRIITFGPEISYYMTSDGSAAKNEVVEREGNLYLYDANSRLIKSNSWIELNGQWYFPNSQGVLYRNRAITFGEGNLYYMGADGTKQTDSIIESGSNLYLLGEDGKSRTDNAWVELDGNQYFSKKDGSLYRNEFLLMEAGLVYYFNNDGLVNKNEFWLNKYLFTPDALGVISAQQYEEYLMFTNKLIFIDPGHGGLDSGAHAGGIREATINMNIANMVYASLVDSGYEVVMSRTTDTDISLIDRAKQANELNASIFISIHNNAMPGSSLANGIETYYYQYYPEYQPQINSEFHLDPDRVSNSLKLATHVHNNMVKYTGAVDRGIRRNTFLVLRETKMPSILIEGGYMTNPHEFSKLVTYEYQRKLANAIVDGIKAYFS